MHDKARRWASSVSLLYFAGRNTLTSAVLVVTGAVRSGKTTIGNILGSCERAEHVDEAWLLTQLPVLVAHGLISEPLGISIFQTYAFELLNGRILLRDVSFRPADRSFIGRQKDLKQIFQRLVQMETRADVRRYLAEGPTKLILTMPDTFAFCDFFPKAVPGCIVLHVVREGYAVAQDVAGKGWLSDSELLRPVHSYLSREYRSPEGPVYHLPFWVEAGREETFIEWTEYSRGLYYWRRQMDLGRPRAEAVKAAGGFQTLKFPEVLRDPERRTRELIASLDMSPTEITAELVHKIAPTPEPPSRALPADADKEELSAVLRICKQLGM